MSEAWDVERTAKELNVSTKTLQRWRSVRTGPEWRLNRVGEYMYLASSVSSWRSNSDNPWADHSDGRPPVVHPGSSESPPSDAEGPQKLRDLWPSYNHLGEVTYFSTPEAAKRDYDHRTGYAAEQGLPKMPPFPPVTQAALGSTPSPAAVREIADTSHGFTLPERKPKSIGLPDTPEWLKNLKK